MVIAGPKDPIAVINRYEDRTPVPIFDILLDLNIGPEFRNLDDDVSALIEKRDDGYAIVINRRHSLNRQRFSAAHALGHWIFHRDLLGAGTGDTRAYRSEGTPLPNLRIDAVHERQANTVAANILMPKATIMRLMAEGTDDPAALAGLLGVSEGAMRVRLGLPAKPQRPNDQDVSDEHEAAPSPA